MYLEATLIDVGWGDSILVTYKEDENHIYRALIDSNDKVYDQSSIIFLRKYFIREEIKVADNFPIFDFIMISHWHDDHTKGLQRIIREFGTRKVYYPKTKRSETKTLMEEFLDDENERTPHHIDFQSVDDSKILKGFGNNIKMEILWPPKDFEPFDKEEENNNSIVLKMSLNNVNYIFTGDAESKVWNRIAKDIPSDTKFFKVPHHGSKNGTFVGRNTPWLDRLNSWVTLGISGHDRGVNWQLFPQDKVVSEFSNKNRNYYRTDNQYHLSFISDGLNNHKVKVKYSRI